jgi:hypothetical protein
VRGVRQCAGRTGTFEEATLLGAGVAASEGFAGWVGWAACVGLDAGTAARVLGTRPGAVRTAAYRGLRALAKKVAEEE